MAAAWGDRDLYGSLGRALHQSRVVRKDGRGPFASDWGAARCGTAEAAWRVEAIRGESGNCGKENREEGGPRRGEFIAAVFSALPSIFPVSLPL